MKRLTYDFCIGDCHCWQVHGADNLLCKEVCERQTGNGCNMCPIKKAFDRLAAYENTGLDPDEIDKTTYHLEEIHINNRGIHRKNESQEVKAK